MRAAIYCRKSTEQNVGEDAKSITMQVDLARAYAEKNGWTVDAEHIYIDDAISGAEYARRPAYLRMMAALDPIPPFDRVVVMEQSRLGRDTARVLLAIEQMEEAGVEVWSYRGHRISTADESGEVHATIIGLVDRMRRRQDSKNTREKMQGYAKAG